MNKITALVIEALSEENTFYEERDVEILRKVLPNETKKILMEDGRHLKEELSNKINKICKDRTKKHIITNVERKFEK